MASGASMAMSLPDDDDDDDDDDELIPLERATASATPLVRSPKIFPSRFCPELIRLPVSLPLLKEEETLFRSFP
jgi:hypothetical protein